MNDSIYFIQKEAVYYHGVFWIGNNIDDAKKECDRLAKIDCDDHHSYCVYKFGLLNADKLPRGESKNYIFYDHHAKHELIYSKRKENK